MPLAGRPIPGNPETNAGRSVRVCAVRKTWATIGPVAAPRTLYIESISNTVFRTGGVLGRPEDSAEDADSDLDRLDDGMWMFTAPGGPGWIAFASQDAAERLAAETVSGSGAYTIRVNNTFRELMRVSPEAYLFISDGTGYDSFGICAAKLGEMELSFIV